MASSKSRRYTPQTERELNVPGLKVIGPVNDCFVATVDYRNYHLLKKPSGYAEDVAQELQRDGEEDRGAVEGPQMFLGKI